MSPAGAQPDEVEAKSEPGTEARDPSGLVQGLVRGEPRALARAITAVESDSKEAVGILAGIQSHLGNARIVGITGPPGAGKSTLTDAIITELRRRGKRVAVLAVDPSSPFSGGALLGDRIRILGHAEDEGVFVRSVASRGHLGGLFRNVAGVLQVMDASGPDVIIVETVGAGQSEVDVIRFTEITVVVCVPGLGDDIQAMKAGILEIADILVVNKSDQPHAEDTVRELRGMLRLRDPRRGTAVVMSTTATTGRGVPELVDLLEEPRSAEDDAANSPEISG